MKKILLLSLSSCFYILFSACSDKPHEQPSMPTDKREERPTTPHPASNYTVEIKKDDWGYVTKFTDSLMSRDQKRILLAFTEYRQRADAGFHLGLAVNTVMKNGTAEQRILIDNLITALCKVAEGSETTELYKAHSFLVGTTQLAFEAAGASGPGSIPPAKNVLEWWKSSKVRSLLLAN